MRHMPRFHSLACQFAYAIAFICCLSSNSPVSGEVVRVEIHQRQPFADGMPFGATGAYEAIRGRMYLEVDPEDSVNETIADLKRAPTNERGKVETWSDFFLLQPVDPLRGNRRLLYDVNNRGNLLALWTFNQGERTNNPLTAAHAGDGFLMRQGYSLLWCGWNGDVVDDGTDRLLVGLPIAEENGEPVIGKVHIEISVDEPAPSWTFGWSPWGVADAYGAIDVNDPEATLTMRSRRSEPGTALPRDAWAFAREENGEVIPDPRSVYVKEELKPGWLYDLVFTSQGPRVAGLGLAAIRDVTSYVRYDDESPLAGAIDHACIFGISQSGRAVNQFLYDGFNTDPKGRIVFEGAIAHVPGSGRGLFNHRFGLATLYGTHHRDNLAPSESFPFATVRQQDPDTGRDGEVLARARQNGHVPKLFYAQSATEYWSRGASLLHTDVEGKRDIEVDPNVRIYLASGAQHLGTGPHTRGIGQQPRNVLDDRPPILRALLVAMDEWVGEDREPPESRYPRIDDGTLVPVETFHETFPEIPGVNRPMECYAPLRLDFGPRWETERIADVVPPKTGRPYRTLVPQVDADGNELAGIRLPDVAVPLGTFTGWNLRSAEYGAEGMLAGLEGMYLPFAVTRDEREQAGDPRPSVLERYPTRADYLQRYVEATLQLERDRLLLPEDAVQLIRTARDRDLWPAE
jgi:hypothetical protein